MSLEVLICLRRDFRPVALVPARAVPYAEQVTSTAFFVSFVESARGTCSEQVTSTAFLVSFVESARWTCSPPPYVSRHTDATAGTSTAQATCKGDSTACSDVARTHSHAESTSSTPSSIA